MSQDVHYHTFLSIVLKYSIHLVTHSLHLVINLQVFLSPANTVLPFVLFGKMLKVCKIWLVIKVTPIHTSNNKNHYKETGKLYHQLLKIFIIGTKV